MARDTIPITHLSEPTNGLRPGVQVGAQHGQIQPLRVKDKTTCIRVVERRRAELVQRCSIGHADDFEFIKLRMPAAVRGEDHPSPIR